MSDRTPVPMVGGAAEKDVFVFPLSFAQERLWFMDQLLPDNSLFNLSTAVRLRLPLNGEAIERSLNEILRRHESLRTSFVVIDGHPAQVIAPSLHMSLPIVDLAKLPPTEREREADRLANEEAHTPFDLRRAPLLRVKVLRLEPADFVLLVTMHHIISDGWSMGIFWNELSAIWSAFAAGRPSPLPEPSIQYADFALWQREWLQGRVLAEQLAFWREKLRGAPVLELPHDFPRPPVQTFSGATYDFTLSRETAAGLNAVCQSEGVTPFMVLLAAFQTLLHRYTGQEDIVVGSYIAGRNRAEVEGLIGFFLNSLVIRVDASGNPSFREMLARVRNVTVEAYAHQDVPFAKLVEELQPERDLSRNPFFQVMFQMLNVPTLSRFEKGEKPDLLETRRSAAVFDLSCMFAQSPDGLAGHLEYNTDLFRHETIVRLAGHYERLLGSAVSQLDQRLSELTILSGEERRQVVREWSTHRVEHPMRESLTELFEAQTRRRPQAPALILGPEKLTFGELNRRANQLAHRLKRLGVGRETLVGICLERSFDLAALLAVFKAGAAYLPLDPGYPQERLRFMVRDAAAPVVVTRAKFLALFAGCPVKILDLDAEREAIAAELDSNLGGTAAPQDLAHVIYTSGSTGQPKGVAVEHRQLLNRFAWMWNRYPFAKGEVGCQKTALGFVDSIWEIFGPLLKGVPVVIIPDAVVKDPLALVRLLGEQRVTRLWLVPSLLQAILESHSDLNRRLPALKVWVSSGEPLPKGLAEQFRWALPDAALYNLYGTSEVWDVTWFAVGESSGPRVPIGRPIDNMEAYVLDQHLQPVPVGIPGELHVGGAGLARGYLNRPELTKARFIANPFADRPGARLYKTGDLVTWLPDGDLDYLGRMDAQAKIRGVRIEPGEIEALLAEISDIGQAAVVVREDVAGQPRLVAYFTTRNGTGDSPEISTLRRRLKERLPECMVPSAFLQLDGFPLTPSGKVDRRRLPPPNGGAGEQARGCVAPQTTMEQKIAAIWKEVLQINKPGTSSNFFDLGGHSLLIYQVYSKLLPLSKRPLAITDLFRYPTIRSLAQFCAAHEPSSAPKPRQKTSARPRRQKAGAE
jgi:amino acid adenylation domain-containing protein